MVYGSSSFEATLDAAMELLLSQFKRTMGRSLKAAVVEGSNTATSIQITACITANETENIGVIFYYLCVPPNANKCIWICNLDRSMGRWYHSKKGGASGPGEQNTLTPSSVSAPTKCSLIGQTAYGGGATENTLEKVCSSRSEF